ncbi:MAG: hypothetical protein U0835_17130 [Isosphaeraceae bacterium]
MWQWPWDKKKPEPVRPPKVGGTRAPDDVRRIDFTRPHDFHFRFGYDRGDPKVFRRCLLVGFTTPGDEQSGVGGGFGEYAHNRWLVLRQEDGRLVYVPRDSLLFIEESEPEAGGATATAPLS